MPGTIAAIQQGVKFDTAAKAGSIAERGSDGSLRATYQISEKGVVNAGLRIGSLLDKAASFDADGAECEFYRVDTTSGVITATLPPAAANPGIRYGFKRTVGGNNVLIQADGSELIDGANTYTITALYGVVWVESNGTKWDIINKF